MTEEITLKQQEAVDEYEKKLLMLCDGDTEGDMIMRADISDCKPKTTE